MNVVVKEEVAVQQAAKPGLDPLMGGAMGDDDVTISLAGIGLQSQSLWRSSAWVTSSWSRASTSVGMGIGW